ncbi:thymopoietin a isoform X1 [Misgurnus anguillicaudatus]|uniref:thymopoietin a isoform X1 n=1 Tax=Misgurnus anguillicaudatus TaxID=75329 RepID=UPI003CCF1DB0
MSEFLEDPSVLTKERLKSALQAHNVALPNGDQRKDVYVQLYLKYLTAQNKKSSGSQDVFSSDEELPPAPVVSNKSRSGRKATRKTDRVRPEEIHVNELTDEGLKDLLLKYGVNAGPIVASTRKVYEKRLQKLLDHGPPEAVTPPSEASQTDGSQNGNTDSEQYSDKEEEIVAQAPMLVLDPDPEEVVEPIPVVEKPIRSRGKTPVTTRTRSGQHNKEDKQEDDWPVLNIKRKLKTSSLSLDQTVPASDDTENSEVSSSEFFTDAQDRRRTGPVTTGKESGLLFADKTSKLFSKSESQKRRSAPVRSFRPDMNEVPSNVKDFSDTPIVKGVSIPLVRIKANTLAVSKEPKPSKHSSISEFDWSESPKRHSSPFQSAVSNLQMDTPIDKFDENSTDITSPPIRPSNREPLVSLINTACVEVDDHGVKDILSCKYTSRSPVALSREAKSFTPSKLSKNINPHLSQNQLSKPLTESLRRFSSPYEDKREDFLSSPSFRESASCMASGDSLLAVSVNLSQESCVSPETQPKTKQSKITPFLSPVTPLRGFDSIQAEAKQAAMVEKVSAIDHTPRTVEKDVLKEIFPSENLNTPTGISATCRRPIRGAAGRPFDNSWLNESRLRYTGLSETSTSYTETRSVSQVAAVPLPASKPVAPSAVKSRARRGLPVWVQLLLLSAVAGFLFFVYQTMETNESGLFRQSGADDSTSK